MAIILCESALTNDLLRESPQRQYGRLLAWNHFRWRQPTDAAQDGIGQKSYLLLTVSRDTFEIIEASQLSPPMTNQSVNEMQLLDCD